MREKRKNGSNDGGREGKRELRGREENGRREGKGDLNREEMGGRES